MLNRIDLSWCPACGCAPHDELEELIDQLEQKVGRLENHVIATDRENEELKKTIAKLGGVQEAG
jgi:chaperonin cofactor prefoldin